MRCALEDVHEVAGGVGEDDDVADLGSVGKAQPPPGQELPLDAVGADEIALDRRTPLPSARRAGAVDRRGSRRTSSGIACDSSPGRSARCRRARCLRNSTRAAVRPQPSSSERPGSQRSCRPRERSAAAAVCRAARVSTSARRTQLQPRPAHRLLVGGVDVRPAADLAVVGGQAEAVSLERERFTAARQRRAVLAPEELPGCRVVQVAHRHAPADVDEGRPGVRARAVRPPPRGPRRAPRPGLPPRSRRDGSAHR